MRPAPDSPPASPLPEAIVTAASEWLARRDRGLTPAEQDAYLEWLRQDDRHGVAITRLEKSWGALDLLAEWRPEHSAQPNPDLLAVPHRRWKWVAGFAAIAAALVVGIFVAPQLSESSPGARVERLAELRTLADGSVVELNKGAEIAVEFTAAERHIRLVRGEAYFTVAKNPARPFVVTAGGVRVRAVGTVFNVRLNGSDVDVLVTEGKVRVDPPKPDEPGVSGALNAAMVGAGERTTVNAAVPTPLAPQVVEVTPAEVEHALAWQGVRIKFDNTSLADAVREFNRYHRETRLVVDDPRIARLPLGGNFRADNADAFVRMLESTAGVHAELRDGRYILRASAER